MESGVGLVSVGHARRRAHVHPPLPSAARYLQDPLGGDLLPPLRYLLRHHIDWTPEQ